MRAFQVMTTIGTLLLMLAILVLSPLDEPAESTGLFNMPMQEIARRRQPPQPVAESRLQAGISQPEPSGGNRFQPATSH